jgi:hypothetical protein
MRSTVYGAGLLDVVIEIIRTPDHDDPDKKHKANSETRCHIVVLLVWTSFDVASFYITAV